MTQVCYLIILTVYIWVQSDMEIQKTEPVKPSKEESGQVIDAANVTTANFGEESNVEDYLKKMVDENPSNPLFLKKYAQFLLQVRFFLFYF